MSVPPPDVATSPPSPPDDKGGMNVSHPRTPAGMIGWSIFASRWVQAPLYIGLIAAQIIYVVKFWKELVHLVVDFSSFDENAIMLTVLGLVDVVMIANLLIMVIIGGYETFVSRMNMRGHPDEPEWLSSVNPNILKVKLAMSIIGISSIHLLKTFIEARSLEPKVIMWQTLIHLTFVVSAVALALIDRIGHGSSSDNGASH